AKSLTTRRATTAPARRTGQGRPMVAGWPTLPVKARIPNLPHGPPPKPPASGRGALTAQKRACPPGGGGDAGRAALERPPARHQVAVVGGPALERRLRVARPAASVRVTGRHLVAEPGEVVADAVQPLVEPDLAHHRPPPDLLAGVRDRRV